jgi:hypothetical protein
VKSNSLFADLLARGVTFYRSKLPNYASIVHPGGAPEWVVRKWMDISVKPQTATAQMPVRSPIPKAIEEDLKRLKRPPQSQDEAIAGLLDLFEEDLVFEPDDLLYPL